MSALCDNCGAQLPNAAGPGLYCPACGEPVTPPQRRDTHAQAEAFLLLARQNIKNAAAIYKRQDGEADEARVSLCDHAISDIAEIVGEGHARS